ncbi:isochorismatase family protein [Grosmannia clavigera kw1407]|uniref:Isochorismatase family protein n=1 Tax=Grosmannia clavigera (strain kw1407 / UAMH 11150) TaxID=655863 RepID=F0XMR8_GROCL|nr:isochorismatase family protein [Grosmannia clavigera kw1407]EFX01377.1 isochorismatase family protein [Grosmannia clavigera kw1407]
MSVQTIRSILGAPSTPPTIDDSILLIIDAQNEYAAGLLKVARLEETNTAIKALLNRYRKAGSSVIHVVMDVPEGAPIFTPGTPLAAILDGLEPAEDEQVVHKTHASAFTGTNLQELLVKTGKKKLSVVGRVPLHCPYWTSSADSPGYMAHNCVSATIRVAAELGYDVYAVRDAIGDRDIPGATAEELVRVSLAEVADVVSVIVESKDIR